MLENSALTQGFIFCFVFFILSEENLIEKKLLIKFITNNIYIIK